MREAAAELGLDDGDHVGADRSPPPRRSPTRSSTARRATRAASSCAWSIEDGPARGRDGGLGGCFPDVPRTSKPQGHGGRGMPIIAADHGRSRGGAGQRDHASALREAPGAGLGGLRPARARARTRRACGRRARRPSSRPSTRSGRGPSRPLRRAARCAGCARIPRPGSLDLDAHAAGVQRGQLELDDLILTGAAVAHGVVHELAGEQEQRALQLRGEPRGRALDPGTRSLGRAATAGDRDAKPLAGRTEVSVGDLARWNEPSGGWRPCKRAGPGLGPLSASAVPSLGFSGATPELAACSSRPPAKYDASLREMKVEDPEQALTEAVCSRVREHLDGADAELRRGVRAPVLPLGRARGPGRARARSTSTAPRSRT